MAHKVIVLSKSVGRYATLSKTPKNRSKDNFFYKELQDKYNAEWRFAPNVVNVEYELERGSDKYGVIEVRDQPLRNDKGEAHADDLRRLVFKDLWEKRFDVGCKFRFSERFDDENSPKSVWLVVNMKYLNPGTSVTVEKCNTTLGFYVDADNDGVSDRYYEPAIIDDGLSGVSTFFNETAVVPQAGIKARVQYNDRTNKFYINQRFIIGRDMVYRVKNIYKFDESDTYGAEKPGLIDLNLEFVEVSAKDDFWNRIAYPEHDTVAPNIDSDAIEKQDGYSIKWVPIGRTEIPLQVPSGEAVRLKAQVYNGTTVSDKTADISISLENLVYDNLPQKIKDTYPDLASVMALYVTSAVDDQGIVSLQKKRNYLNGSLILTAKNNELGISSSIKLQLS